MQKYKEKNENFLNVEMQRSRKVKKQKCRYVPFQKSKKKMKSRKVEM